MLKNAMIVVAITLCNWGLMVLADTVDEIQSVKVIHQSGCIAAVTTTIPMLDAILMNKALSRNEHRKATIRRIGLISLYAVINTVITVIISILICKNQWIVKQSYGYYNNIKALNGVEYTLFGVIQSFLVPLLLYIDVALRKLTRIINNRNSR